jgi:hypothetical protein
MSRLTAMYKHNRYNKEREAKKNVNKVGDLLY